MPDSTQAQTQQLLQNLTGAQTAASPSGVAGNINNGNPGTVYNIAPQSDAQGNWWNPGRPAMNPMVANILNGIHGGVPLPAQPPGTPVVNPTGPTATTQQPPLPAITTGNTARPGGGSDQDGYCVASSMFLEGAVRASKAVKGLVATTHTPEEGFQLHAIESVFPVVVQPCVELVTEKGAILVCSVTTPFTLVGAETDDNTLLAPAMLGELVYVKRGKITKPEKVTSVTDAGDLEVVPISYGGRSFPAGKVKGALIYSHNLIKGPNGANLYALRDSLTTMFENNNTGHVDDMTTRGQLAAMTPQQAALFVGGYAYQPGGSLYTGGSVPLPLDGRAVGPDGSATTAATNPAPYGYDPNGKPLIVPLTQPGTTVPTAAHNNLWQGAANLLSPVPLFNEGQFDPMGAIKAEATQLKNEFMSWLGKD